MRMVTYRREGVERVGFLWGRWVVDVNRVVEDELAREGNPHARALAAAQAPAEATAFLAAGEPALAAARRALEQAAAVLEENPGGRETAGGPGSDQVRQWREKGLAFPVDEVQLAMPVPQPGRIICIGLNYREHAREAGLEVPRRPMFFHRWLGSMVGPGEPLLLPAVSDSFDFEGELAVVIGKPARYVTRDEALAYVAGYTVFNDGSIRAYHPPAHSLVAGKNFDATGSMGPALVFTDEIKDPGNLRLRTWVDGELMQDSSTGDMIFDVPTLVAYLSEFMTLMPGDVIATGTPSGVGLGRTPKRWLRPGETVAVEVEGVGRLENPVRRDERVPRGPLVSEEWA